MAKRALFVWHTKPTFVTGQDIVTDVVLNAFKSNCYIVNLSVSGSLSHQFFSVLVNTLKLAFGLLYLRRSATVYVVVSRSRLGFFRDIPALIVAQLGVHTVAHAHGSDVLEFLTHGKMAGFRRWIYQPVLMIVPSKHLVKDLVNLGLTRIRVVENPLPTLLQTEDLSVITTASSTLRMLWNSNVIGSKGFVEVANAVRFLVASGYQVHLTAFGRIMADDCCSATELRELIDRCVSEGMMTYLGVVTLEESIALYQGVDVICLPSRYKSECQPIALILAMCFGKAIVIADTPALRATVDGYPAVITAKIDPAGLGHSILQAVKEKSLTDMRVHSLNSLSRFSRKRFIAEMAICLEI